MFTFCDFVGVDIAPISKKTAVKCDFKIVFATLWRLIYAKIALKHVYNFGVGSFCKPVVIFKRFFCVCFANHKGGMVQLPYNCQVGQP